MSSYDPVSLGIMWDRLNSITDEMTNALIRTSFSTIVREGYDLSVVLFDAHGRSLAQGRKSAVGHSGTAPNTVRYVVEHFPVERMRPGDVFITNDSWHGTGHIYDMNFVRPAFRGGTLVGFTFSDSHMPDIGGVGFAANTADMYAEGLRVPPSRLMREGVPNEELLNLIRANVRVNEQVVGDMMANVTCNELGERLLVEFMEEYGIDDLSPLADAILSQSEAVMREKISEMPDGVYHSELVMEGLGEPIKLVCKATITGSDIHLDFTGTDPIVAGGINTPMCYTRAHSIYAVRLLTVPTLPCNEGSTRPITFTAPDNCILNALPPAPTAGRHVVGHYATPLVLQALESAVPQRVQANSGMVDLISVQGQHPEGHDISLMYFTCGGYGAQEGMDGIPAMPTPTSIKAVPVEVWESLTGFTMVSKRIVPDSGGVGQFRGGPGHELVFRNDTGHLLNLSLFGRQTQFPAKGMRGGGSGQPHVYLIDGQPVDPIGRHQLPVGSTLTVIEPGGGGFGDPKLRDPAAVRADVHDGFLTPAAALRDYGISVEVA